MHIKLLLMAASAVFCAWLAVSIAYLFYAGLLSEHLKAHHPVDPRMGLSSDSQYYFRSGRMRKGRIDRVLVGAEDVPLDDEGRKLLRVTRLLAVGCVVGMVATLVMIGTLPDIHPPPGYFDFK